MSKKDWHLYDAYNAGIEHGNITFWTAMVGEIIPPHSGSEVVLDFGCSDGQFLRLLNTMRPFKTGVGVDIDEEMIAKAVENLRDGEPIAYGLPSILKEYSNHFDLAFSQEVFWMVRDLPSLARQMHGLLKDKGEYYATMGCHIENPLWIHRRRLLREEGYEVFDYSLDQVADVFHEAGFEVGLKRLPVQYFNLYHPGFTRPRAQSLSKLVETTHEHKMLFYFRRDDEWRAEVDESHNGK